MQGNPKGAVEIERRPAVLLAPLPASEFLSGKAFTPLQMITGVPRARRKPFPIFLSKKKNKSQCQTLPSLRYGRDRMNRYREYACLNT